MALIIEDGTIVANADAWADVAACSAWAVDHYGAALAGNDADKEAAIRRAVLFMNSLPWKGTPTAERGQTLAHPRTGLTDGNGYAVGINEIAPEIISAQHMLARVEFKTNGVLAPVVKLSDTKVLIEVKGIKWKPLASENTVAAARPQVTMALDILEGFLDIDYSDVGIGFNSVGGFSDG